MSSLSDSTQCVVITALVARRNQLKGLITYWSEVLTRSRTVAGAEAAHDEAVKHLAETEAAMIELDKRAVPWLHCHPDCSDLFEDKTPSPAVARAA